MSAHTILALALLTVVYNIEGYPIHASCKITWQFPSVACADVKDKITSQMNLWQTADNCKQGGEKCLYKLTSQTDTQIKGTHTTPVKHYVDDLTFSLSPQGSGCQVGAFSTSETWYAFLDYGTNYCNLRNLVDGQQRPTQSYIQWYISSSILLGSGLNKTTGFQESTSDSVCTQYSSHDCEKY